MTLNTREKYIAMGVGAAVVLAIVYSVAVPFIAHGNEIAVARAAMEKNLDLAEIIKNKSRTLRPVWVRMKDSEGLTSDVPDAVNQIEEALQGWAQSSGVNLTNMNPSQGALNSDVRSDKPEAKFQRLEVSAKGTGSMAQITKLMWKLESAPKLLKVLDMQVKPRLKEATDDLQFTVKIGTVSLAPVRPGVREIPTNNTAGEQP